MGQEIMDKAERKRLKKEQKAAAAAAQQSEEAPQPKPKKKKESSGAASEEKKKSKKRDVEASSDMSSDTTVKRKKKSDGDASEKTKKKTKTPTASQPAAAASAVKFAAVGDRDLARSRPALTKALYTESAEVKNMREAEVAAWRAERSVTLEDAEARPLTSFAQSGLSAAQLHAVRAFKAPSPIQAQCLPLALQGRDVVGIAATGSGKTLAFGLPALAHIAAQVAGGAASGRRPVALVLAPTRELALQICAVLEEAGAKCGVAALCIYGGVPKGPQIAALRKGVQIVVATPGRLEDLLQDKAVSLSEVSYLVLDEADRMLDLGFEPHIRAIAAQTRADRQTLMFSATWPNAIRKLAAEFLCAPARVVIGSPDLAASHSVRQVVEVIEDRDRDARLHALLQGYHDRARRNRVIVFVLYKKEAARVEAQLTRRGWKAGAVHGDISQAQRTAAVEAFRDASVPILVATDVAARGLDIPDVEVVINYSFPLTTEDYVHRIGRTGRAGKKGVAHTFFVGANDKPRAGELINVLKEAGQEVPAELYKFGTTVKKKESKLYGAHFKDVDPTQKATKISFDSDDE